MVDASNNIVLDEHLSRGVLKQTLREGFHDFTSAAEAEALSAMFDDSRLTTEGLGYFLLYDNVTLYHSSDWLRVKQWPINISLGISEPKLFDTTRTEYLVDPRSIPLVRSHLAIMWEKARSDPSHLGWMQMWGADSSFEIFEILTEVLIETYSVLTESELSNSSARFESLAGVLRERGITHQTTTRSQNLAMWIELAFPNIIHLLASEIDGLLTTCLLYTSPSPRDQRGSRMPSSA